MAQELLVARYTYIKYTDGQDIRTMSREAVERHYPDFAEEVRLKSVDLAPGTNVDYYWQTPGALEKDRLGVVATLEV